MPFRAFYDGEIVTPADVPDQTAVECPECSGKMYPRDSPQRARHFYHVEEAARGACSAAGGESDTHVRCTALAVAALREQVPDAARAGAEVQVDATATATAPDVRRADALVEYQDENPYFGRGLIIEVQHKHHSKDIQGTTHDYLAADYSVVWLTPADFENEHLPYDVVEDAFRSADGEGYSVRDHDSWEFETRPGADLVWEAPTPHHQHDHYWSRIPAYAHPENREYERCPCGLRRQYDDELTRYVYDVDGVLAPTDPVVELPLPNDVDARPDDIVMEPTEVNLEEALAVNRFVRPCRGPKSVHEWGSRRERIMESGRLQQVIWECDHCPVRLVKNRSGEFVTVAYPEWSLEGVIQNPYTCNHRAHAAWDDSWDYCPICGLNDPTTE